MGVRLKTLSIKLKTGEMYIKKDVEEFFIGKSYFVLISNSLGPISYPLDNILLIEFLKDGGYNKIYPKVNKWTRI